MNWTSATSIGPRPAHPSRMRVLSEHCESTDLSRSPLEGSDLLGKNSSPRPGDLFSSYTIPLSLYFCEFAHRLRADRGHAGVHFLKFLKRKPAYSAQFLCRINPFRMNTYEKTPRGGGLLLTSSSIIIVTAYAPFAGGALSGVN